MTLAEILDELPTLNADEVQLIREKLREVKEKDRAEALKKDAPKEANQQPPASH